MVFLKFLLLAAGFSMLTGAAALVLCDIFLAYELSHLLRKKSDPSLLEVPESLNRPASLAKPEPASIRWHEASKLAAVAVLAILAGKSILVIPDGHAAVRVSQLSGVVPGTLYSGTHLIVPLFERAEMFDVRDRVFGTSATEGSREKVEALTVEAREGLSVGLAVTVRYRIDPRRLDYIQANLPQPVDEQIVAPVVTSVFRELGPNYVVRDLFATKREEFRTVRRRPSRPA
jgi:hypothetical protein